MKNLKFSHLILIWILSGIIGAILKIMHVDNVLTSILLAIAVLTPILIIIKFVLELDNRKAKV